ncbi:MAG: porin [Betaproteobacteria bacterium]|nr:porin [Betaproteobacteria bacterium]
MLFQNPSTPLAPGAGAQGGDLLSVLSNTAFANNKILQVVWTGAKWAATPNFDLTAAYYHENQNSFSGNGCGDASLATCGGTEDAFSLVGDYRINKHLDVYAGAMYPKVGGGIANGFFHTSSIDPTIGARVKFLSLRKKRDGLRAPFTRGHELRGRCGPVPGFTVGAMVCAGGFHLRTHLNADAAPDRARGLEDCSRRSSSGAFKSVAHGAIELVSTSVMLGKFAQLKNT